VKALLVLAWAAAAAWVVLLLGRDGFWRMRSELPTPRALPTALPSVAVVVPARDEAQVLPHTLPALLAQKYPGAFFVVLVDDESRDGTGAQAAAIARAAGPSARLTVVAGRRPP
jgi:hypothetical protein